MLEKYKDSQRIFYDYFKLSFDKQRISHAYLIETGNVSYAYGLALDLAKFLLCNGVYDERICELVDCNNYPNLKIVGGMSDIKKGEIVSLKNDFSLKSVNCGRQVYIVRNAEVMNKSAANSLLKFLEEPEGDVVAILLCDSVSNVLSTISSRCQVIQLVNDDNDYNNIFVSLYEKCDDDIDFNDFICEYGAKFLRFYLDFEKDESLILASDDFYTLGQCVNEFLLFGLYMYFDVLNIMLARDCKFLPRNFNLEEIVLNNDINGIIRKIDVVNKFIYDFRFNVNVNLFLDNFIISLRGDI